MTQETAPMPVKAVLFDYGLVLTGPPHPPAWERMKGILSADESSFHRAYWRPRHEYDRGTLTGEQYWREVASDLERPIEDPASRELILADTELWTQPNQPMIDWALALQARGVRTGILSNLGDAMEEGVRDRCSWLSGFTHYTFSHRLRIAKPEAAIYQHAAEGLGVPPAEVLFIDDREDNIEGARLAGMKTVRYTDHDSFLNSMRAGGFAHLLEPAFA